MVTWRRGFRRISWLFTLAAAPFIFWAAWESSERQVGYVPQLLTDTAERTWQKSVRVENVGVVYVPAYLTNRQIEDQMRLYFEPASNPAAFKNEPGKYSIKE